MKIILFILAFCVSYNSYTNNKISEIDNLKQIIVSQKKDTSLVDNLIKLSKQYQTKGSYDSSIQYGNKALELATKLEFQRGIIASHNNIGGINYYQGDYNKALSYFFKALAVAEEINDDEGISNSYNNIGMIYQGIQKYDDALLYLNKALVLREKVGSKKQIADSYNNIGTLYLMIGEFDKADFNIKKGLKIRLQLDDLNAIASSYNNIGANLQNKGFFLKEEGSFNEAKLNFGLALDNYFEALKIQEKINDKRSLATSIANIGWVYSYKEDYIASEKWFKKALVFAEEIEEKNLIKSIYGGLSVVNEEMGDYKNAYLYLQLHSQYTEIIFNEESNKQIVEIQTKYDTEKKQKTIEIQSLQLSQQELQIKQNRTQLLLLIIGIILIIVIAYIIIYRIRIKQRQIIQQNKLEQQRINTKVLVESLEKERVRIARDLHDGIGQTLASAIVNHEQLNSVVKLLDEDKKQTFNTTSASLDVAYKELRDISHQMMPRALKLMGISEAISDLLDKSLSSTQIKYSFNNQHLEDLPENIAIGIYRIFQELLSNIIKHSQATSVAVNLFKSQQQITLIVEDNGIGLKDFLSIKKTDNSVGVGLTNISARSEIMDGTIIFEKGKDSGTITTLIIPFN